eukprot:tig00001182_g7484.t1
MSTASLIPGIGSLGVKPGVPGQTPRPASSSTNSRSSSSDEMMTDGPAPPSGLPAPINPANSSAQAGYTEVVPYGKTAESRLQSYNAALFAYKEACKPFIPGCNFQNRDPSKREIMLHLEQQLKLHGLASKVVVTENYPVSNTFAFCVRQLDDKAAVYKTIEELRELDIRDLNNDRIHFESTILIEDRENPTLAFHGMPPLYGRGEKKTDQHTHIRHEECKEKVTSFIVNAFTSAKLPRPDPVEVQNAILGIGYEASTFAQDRQERLNARPVLFAAMPRKYADVLLAMSKDYAILESEHQVCIRDVTATGEQRFPLSEYPKDAIVLLMTAPKGRRPDGSLVVHFLRHCGVENIHHWEIFYVESTSQAPFALRLVLRNPDFERYVNSSFFAAHPLGNSRPRWRVGGLNPLDIRFRLIPAPAGEPLGIICTSVRATPRRVYASRTRAHSLRYRRAASWTTRTATPGRTGKCPKAQDDFIKKTADYAAAKAVRVCGAPVGSAVAKAAAEAARAAAARSATDTFRTDLARTRAAVNADADTDSDDDDRASVVSAASVSTTSSAVRRFSLLDMQRPMRRNERRAAEREAAAAAAAAGMMPAPPAPRQQTGRESKRRLAQKAAEIAANKAAKRYLNQAA